MSLKDALTTPPQVSSAQTAGAQAGTSTSAAPGETLPGVENPTTAQTGRMAGRGGRAKVASHRSRSKPRHRTAAAHPAESPSQPGRQGTIAKQNVPFVEQGAAKTGTYPKFVPPKAATSQMTEAEKKRFEEMMAARLKANQQLSETPAEAAERKKLLKALAAKHANDTLKTIGDR